MKNIPDSSLCVAEDDPKPSVNSDPGDRPLERAHAHPSRDLSVAAPVSIPLLNFLLFCLFSQASSHPSVCGFLLSDLLSMLHSLFHWPDVSFICSFFCLHPLTQSMPLVSLYFFGWLFGLWLYDFQFGSKIYIYSSLYKKYLACGNAYHYF